MKFFNNCKTLDEVKSLFKKLAFENHPDKGGSTEIMQMINAEYKLAIAKMASNKGFTSQETEEIFEMSEKYQNAINGIAGLDGLIIELVGAWIWVTGDTYKNKKQLKEAGFMFASKKCAWYFRPEEKKSSGRSKYDLDTIKSKYGSRVINTSNRAALSA